MFQGHRMMSSRAATQGYALPALCCMHVCTPTGRGWTSRPADVHLPVVEGAAHHGVLPRLQHDVAADELLHRSLAVGQQAAQGELVAAAKGGPKHHDAQVQQVAVCCV